MRELVIGGVYKHFKGHIYEVICEGLDADSLEEKVIYKNRDTNEVWVRSKIEFLSLVDKDKYPNIKQEYRFELID